MKTLVLLATAVLPIGFHSVSVAQAPDSLPPGWRRSGPPQAAAFNTLQLDREVKHGGTSSLRIEAAPSVPDDYFGAVVGQGFLADDFRGRRVRLTGYARLTGGTSNAALWMRIDGALDGVPFDNMADRRLMGTLDWRRCELVLDVPPTATVIVIGALLGGTGTLWIDDFEFTVVDPTVPLTGRVRPPQDRAARADLPRGPGNLGFEPTP